MAIRLVAGLGNPGPDYAAHRHNAGFWLVDQWVADQGERFGIEARLHAETARLRCAGEDVRVLKPTTFMNRSGQAVSAALRYWKIEPEELLVVHDELDLPAGVARLKFDGGHGGQNGLRDTIAQLGHGRFHRLRIGIGHPGHKDRVTGWVLGRPSKEEAIAMRRAIGRALDVFPLLLQGDFSEAMKRLHTQDAAG
jgi:PTH1 family peptidyl-tRNA hydrolase